MRFEGPLNKMMSTPAEPVRYAMELGTDLVVINRWTGKELRLDYQGYIVCSCGKIVDKVFRQNFCYQCFMTKPEAGDFVLRPELSKAHLGVAERDLAFEQAYQLQPHIVYLANSGGLKVGVTRRAQIPTRWIDQGASSAIVLAEVPNRYLAGIIEVELKQHMGDKTVVKKMLSGMDDPVDLTAEKNKAAALLPAELQAYVSPDPTVTKLSYPAPAGYVHRKSLNPEKDFPISATLLGIRGQYWLFSNGLALNVRSYEGRVVGVEV
ncbi:DUF2797 domain-containing protein [bacterium]|nr:DUF2797 domain-containing protein [bacterium]